jgi:hypothetical protein
MSDSQIFDVVVKFFEEDNWNFNWLEGMSVLSVPFTGKSGRWMCYAQAREDQEQFVFYSVGPVNAPPERQAAVAEFITRANYGMIIGNFEMDYNDGEIRYKTSIDVEGDGLTAELIKQLVYANVIIMDRYLPGIMTVIYGNATPVEEIEKIEGTRRKAQDTKLDNGDRLPGDNLSDRVRSRIEDILRNVEEEDDESDVVDEGDEDDDTDFGDLFPPDDEDDDLNEIDDDDALDQDGDGKIDDGD